MMALLDLLEVMADFEMSNFHYFPVEKSSYDLKLELLEELDPKEALELMKANHGFRSIYLRDPWRIIGRHVYSIDFPSPASNAIDFSPYTIKIWKRLGKRPPLACDLRSHLLLLKKIKSCQLYYYRRDRRAIDAAKEVLSNLDSIEEWRHRIEDLESFQECFSTFKGQITHHIPMDFTWYSGEENDPALSFVSKVFETQLGKCKLVVLRCFVDQYSAIYKLFSKTKIKRFLFSFDTTKRFSAAGLEMAMRWIVCNGIPSQNREAEISIRNRFPSQYHSAYDSLGIFLVAFPGIQKMPDEKNVRSYRTKIDDERDCVYEFELNDEGKPNKFSAKYVPHQAQ